MALIDLSRQTTLAVELDHTMIVSGLIDVVNSGVINVLQNALQIDGQPIILTAGEMNYLQGANDNVQNQINNLTISVSGVELVGNWFDNITHKVGAYVDKDTCQFNDVNLPSDFHTGGTADNLSHWLFFVNGQLVEIQAIVSIVDSGSNIRVNIDRAELGFRFRNRHEFVLWGPMINS